MELPPSEVKMILKPSSFSFLPRGMKTWDSKLKVPVHKEITPVSYKNRVALFLVSLERECPSWLLGEASGLIKFA